MKYIYSGFTENSGENYLNAGEYQKPQESQEKVWNTQVKKSELRKLREKSENLEHSRTQERIRKSHEKILKDSRPSRKKIRKRKKIRIPLKKLNSENSGKIRKL